MPIKKRQEQACEFNKVYPDIDIRDIDKGVISKWEETGKPLIDIYNAYIVAKIRQKDDAKKVNENNMKASSGSVSGIPESSQTVTDEMINNMSDKEFVKNFKAILKQYNK